MERCWNGKASRGCHRFAQMIVFASICASLAAWTLPPVDDQFLKAAAEALTSQLALAKLALDKSDRPDIKMYAHQVVTDSEKSKSDLETLAGQKKVKLPENSGLRYKAEKARLELLSGQQFDNAFVTSSINDYTKDLSAFRNESGDGIDSDVRQFASKNMPILREHLTMIKAIRGKIAAE